MLDQKDLQAISEMMDAKLEKQKEELRAEIAGVRTEIAEVRTELQAEIAGVRTEIAEVRTELQAEISASEQRMVAAMDERQARMETFVTGKIETSELRTAQKILASESRLKIYIDERTREAESRAISFAENEITRRQGLIKEGLDLALELPRIPPERVERIEQDVAALMFTVHNQAKKIEALERSA